MKELSPGKIVAGRYKLERRLARGGMGSVWVARHTQLDVLAAIKFMDPTYASSPEARQRFEREAKAAAQLESPHVVAVRDYGVEDGSPYLVMELLQGEDLHARLKRERQLSIAQTSNILGQAAKALRRAHEAGIIHRDIKPRNVFLARADDDEVVKILDFGVAKMPGFGVVGEATRSGMLIGSPHFMAPEQARRARDVDHRSDLWSLAVIVYRAVTGHLPFPGDEVGDVIVKICTDPVPPVERFDPNLPRSLDTFFSRALARNMDERYQTAKELATGFLNAVGARDSMEFSSEAIDAARLLSFAPMSSDPKAIEQDLLKAIEDDAMRRSPGGPADSHPSHASHASHPSLPRPSFPSHPRPPEQSVPSFPSTTRPVAISTQAAIDAAIAADDNIDDPVTAQMTNMPDFSSPVAGTLTAAASAVGVAPEPPPTAADLPIKKRGLHVRILGALAAAVMVGVLFLVVSGLRSTSSPASANTPTEPGAAAAPIETSAPAPQVTEAALAQQAPPPPPSVVETAIPVAASAPTPSHSAPAASSTGTPKVSGKKTPGTPSAHKNPVLGI